MEIKYIGHSSFQIKTKMARIITDPYDPKMVGMAYPKVEADIVTLSHEHPDHNYREGIKSEGALMLDWPGEYEKQEVRVYGFQTYHDKDQGAERGENVMFKFETEDMSVLHCGDLGHQLTQELIEQIGEIDILILPVGGFYTINAEEAAKVVREIEPTIVIPMHYNHGGLDPKTFEQLQPLETFLKEMSAENVEPLDKFVVKKDDLTNADMKVVTLKITNS
ncbi:MAG: MBL fold metallo-hydrolase [Weeksellaceae bacterium]